MRDETGKVCPNLFVNLRGNYFSVSAKTDEHGYYLFDMSAGVYTLQAKGALPSTDQRVTVAEHRTYTVDLLTCRSAADPHIPAYLRGEPEPFEMPMYANTDKPISQWTIVDSPESDLRVAKAYPYDENKGPIENSRRATIMAAKTQYAIGEEVRIIHVMEVLKKGSYVHRSGPKTVYGEYINNALTSKSLEDATRDNHEFDTLVGSPGVEFFCATTSYRFARPGLYKIEWHGGGAGYYDGKPNTSNILNILVMPAK